MRVSNGAKRKPGLGSALIPISRKKKAITKLYTSPPAGSVVVCLDEMGPQASKSYPGQHLVRAAEGARATQEINYGRRDVAGYVFGAPELVEGPSGHGSGVHRDL